MLAQSMIHISMRRCRPGFSFMDGVPKERWGSIWPKVRDVQRPSILVLLQHQVAHSMRAHLSNSIPFLFYISPQPAYFYDGQHNVNLIGINWEHASGGLYGIVRQRVRTIGEFTAKYIDALIKHGALNLANLSLIGFSLGAHIVGIGKRWICLCPLFWAVCDWSVYRTS